MKSYQRVCKYLFVATNLFGDGHEPAQSQRAVGMALAPELDLFTKRCFVLHDEQRCNQVTA